MYSPLIAALFMPFTALPGWSGALIWRLLDAAVFVGVICWWLRVGLHDQIPKSASWLVFLLLLPLSLGNFNNGQVNPLLIGLLMIAVLSAYSKRWTISAVCVGIAAYLKIYPIAVGLSTGSHLSRQLGWRLAVALIILGALPFVLQYPAYAFEQYRHWFSSRAADNDELIMNIGMVLKAVQINSSPRALWLSKCCRRRRGCCLSFRRTPQVGGGTAFSQAFSPSRAAGCSFLVLLRRMQLTSCSLRLWFSLWCSISPTHTFMDA